MEVAGVSETMVIFCQTKRRNVLGKQYSALPPPQGYQTLQFLKIYFMMGICITPYYLIQGDSFGTRPKKMRIYQRLFISVAFSSAWTVVANISSISSSIDMLLMKQGM
jgi:hypothetical protein